MDYLKSMKIDHQDNCEYQFSSISNNLHCHRFLLIVITVIDFYCFVLASVKNAMDKRLALFSIKGREFKENL